MKEFLFQIPGNIEVGFGKGKNLTQFIEKMGASKALIVLDYNLKELDSIKGILANLDSNDIDYQVFSDIRNEPTAAEIDAAVKELAVASNFDLIVGIGGGSTMDLAKLLAVSSRLEGSIKNYLGTNLITGPGLPTIMIPTTSGTGAEITPNAIVKDEEAEVKVGVVSPYLIPDMVILDPELTLTLPARITAETGMDAFTHAIECFICNKSNPMSDLYALESMRLISRYLLRAVEDGTDREARYYLALGSLYGGVAITNSGTGAVHALAYPLGGKYGITHGLSNSILLPDVMEYNSAAVPERFVQVAEAMGIDTANKSDKEAINGALQKIRQLVEESNIAIKGLEINEEVLDDLARSAMTVERLLNNNLRPVDYDSARLIYQKALQKGEE